MTIESAFSSLCCTYVAITMAAAAIGKATYFDGLLDSIGAFAPGMRAARIFAVMLIGSEGAIAGLLLGGGHFRVTGAWCAAGLLLILSAVLAHALARGRAISCNCFGPSERPISRYDLARNATLLVACGFIVTEPLASQSGLLDVVEVVGLGFLLFLVTTNLDLLVPQTRQ